MGAPRDDEPTEEQRRIAWQNAPGWAAEAGWAKPPARLTTGWYRWDDETGQAVQVPGPPPRSPEEVDAIEAALPFVEGPDADMTARDYFEAHPPPRECGDCNGSGRDLEDDSLCPSCGGWGLER